MAVLRFRAWHKKAKKFYECVGFDGSQDSNGVCFIKNTVKKKGAPSVLGDNAEDYEITQSTGLKDSFGVEIFEGDYVLSFEDSEIEKVVTWDSKRASWSLTCSDGLIPLFHYESPLYKVGGNIYQNPEIAQQ